MSTITYAVGDGVMYAGDLPDDDCEPRGEVIAIEVDGVNGAQIVTVEFGCGHKQDILGDELQPAE